MRFLLITLLIFPYLCFSQIYFQDKQTIDLNITIKEPFKPINYAEIGNQFNDVLQQEIARRNALKQYHNDISYQTRDLVMSNVMLTANTTINEKILLLQEKVLKKMSMWYNLLRSGQLNPNSYPNNLKNEYYNFFSANKILLSLYNFVNNQSENSVIENFNNSISCIKDFEFKNSKVICEIVGISEEINSSNKIGVNDLYNLIIKSSNKYLIFKENWNKKMILQTKKLNDVKSFNKIWKEMAFDIIKARKQKLGSYSEKEKKKFLKSEKKFLHDNLGYFIIRNFGKMNKRFANGIDINTEVIIYRYLKDDQKIDVNSQANKFYKLMSYHCNCGNYNEEIFQ